MKALGTPWTQAEFDTIIRMRRAGNSVARVAIALDRTFESVASKIGNLRTAIDGPRKRFPPAPSTSPAGRTLTAVVMGDPPPGRSALDQRRQ